MKNFNDNQSNPRPSGCIAVSEPTMSPHTPDLRARSLIIGMLLAFIDCVQCHVSDDEDGIEFVVGKYRTGEEVLIHTADHQT